MYVTDYRYILLYGFLAFFTLTNPVLAQDITINTIAANTGASVGGLPPLLSALSYLLGALFAPLGVLNLMKAVIEEQHPMRKGWAYLITGGMLFALPTMVTATLNTFSGGEDAPGVAASVVGGVDGSANILGLLGINAGLVNVGVINDLFLRIINSTGSITGIFSLFAYLIGILLIVLAILKLREHIDDPDKTPLREVVIRLLFAAAMLALPFLLSAGASLISNDDNGTVTSLVAGGSPMVSAETGEICGPIGQNVGVQIGDVICQMTVSTNFFPLLLAFLSYIFGIIFIMWAVFKIRDHANNPTQTPLTDGLVRLVVGGLFLALPVAVYAIRASLISDATVPLTGGASKVTGFNEPGLGGGCATGLDAMLSCLMAGGFGPMNIAINLFSIFGGLVLIMIGVSRLVKSTQEGAKGPLGIATIMTFITGAALMASNTLLKVFAASLFGAPTAATIATYQNTIGLSQNELDHIHTIISAILKFLVIIGFISFVRGIFILRGSVEGSQNASTMAAMTHLVGGALAVNLGPLLNVLQNTFGIQALGIAFS